MIYIINMNLRVPGYRAYISLYSNFIQRYSGIILLHFASLEPPEKPSQTITATNLFYFVRFHIFYVQDWKMLNEKKSWCDLLLTPPFGICSNGINFTGVFFCGCEIYGFFCRSVKIASTFEEMKNLHTLYQNIKKCTMIYLISHNRKFADQKMKLKPISMYKLMNCLDVAVPRPNCWVSMSTDLLLFSKHFSIYYRVVCMQLTIWKPFYLEYSRIFMKFMENWSGFYFWGKVMATKLICPKNSPNPLQYCHINSWIGIDDYLLITNRRTDSKIFDALGNTYMNTNKSCV